MKEEKTIHTPSSKKLFLWTALLVILYIITGKIGLELAVPPGYATMIWPPSGIAIGMMILYGWRIWPGVIIGSFLLNAYVSGIFEDNKILLSSAHILPALSIAIGSTLQTLTGWLLVRRYIGFPLNISHTKQVLLLFALCGPLACVVAASIGTSSLYLSGVIGKYDLNQNWWSWWAGDVFGVLVFAPLVLLSPLGKNNSLKWQGTILGSLPFLSIIVIILPLGLTFYVWKVTSEETYKQSTAEFKILAQNSENALLYRITSFSHALTSGLAYFQNVPDMSRKKWNSYASSVSLKENYPGINGIGVIYKVDDSSLESFLQSSRSEMTSGFSIHPETNSGKNYIIKHIYPEEDNAQAIGLNIAFEQRRREAAELARDTGLPTITKKIILVQDESHSPGFLLFYPIYKEAAGIRTLEQRRNSIDGWIYAPFIARKFFKNLTQEQGHYFNIHIYDGSTENPGNLIFSSTSIQQSEEKKPSFKISRKLRIMQQEWLVVWESTKAYESKEISEEPFIILVTGLFFTSLFSILLVLFSVRNLSTLELIVKEKCYIIPVVILCLMLSASLYLYRVINNKEASYLSNILEGQAKSMTSIVMMDSHELILALDRMGDRWSASDEKAENIWNTDMRNYIKDFSSLKSIAWVDREYHIRKIYPPSEFEKQIESSLIDSPKKKQSLLDATSQSRTLVSEPVQFQKGNLGFLIYVPVMRNGRNDGFLVGSVLVKDFFDYSLSKENIDEYSISVLYQNTEIYSSSTLGNTDTSHLSIQKNFMIGDKEYTLTISPPQEYVRNRMGRFAIFVLLCGFIISILMSILSRFVLVARIRAAYLKNAIIEAETANKSKSLFLANISHEIRTPLNGILATTELLEKTPLNDPQKRYVEIVHNSGQLLFNLLNDVLDLSKIEIHKLELHEETFDLHQSIILSTGLFSSSARQKGLDLNCTISPDLPVWVFGDQYRFGQILTNLIGNAVKYTNEGDISITATRDKTSTRSLYMEVSDTGIGIPEKSISSVFDSFSQAHYFPKIEGTGLGLAICKSLVTMMGGEIGVHSKEGEGSTFWIRIPLEVVNSPEIQEYVPPENDNGYSPDIHALLAEDTEANRIIIADMLSYLGCKVDTASNGAEAVEFCRQNKYDMIFMDCNMPVMDGYEATRKIREIRGQDLPIIAISAHAFLQDIQLCYDAGMNDYVHKPAKLDTLKRCILNWSVKNKNQKAGSPATEKTGTDDTLTLVDITPIQELVQNDPEKLKKILSLTAGNAHDLYRDILKDWENADRSSLKSNAHALKSVASQIGGLRLSAICKTLEHEAPSASSETIDDHINFLKKEYDAFAGEIERRLKK